MQTGSARAAQRRMPSSALWPFLLIAFGWAWGLIALFVFLPNQMTRWFGPLTGHHPLFILAVYAPAMAALVVVGYHVGWIGVRRYLSRLLLWRCPPAWMAFILLGMPLLFYAGAAVKGDLFQEPFPFDGLAPMLGALALTLVIGPVEELGWRGLALPLLQRHLAPLWAGLLLGLVWSVWHVPAFLLSGTPQGAWSFMPFLVGATAISVIVTPLFNTSRGSILLPALIHFQANNPLWPDAHPYDTCFFVVAALLVVWLNRQTMFTRHGAVTMVVPVIEDEATKVLPRPPSTATHSEKQPWDS
ncbi:membrane protease YdiL (CAAX protease family) [Hydrogenophaga palleronii]|uniref:Membrane protease YdiL (CAAX protease family) n=1 Tax=Hydrogenophaga palleronii TaxID=65655 RepID=A0ABU1WNR8_9BURK|nr:type II CAAX endopeptidase family protein [Hydrogenophaga palleronii]MDR7150903.1 membrane protease YdiL (CAAX protease family) [Hydrogenophaga palleronii]